MDSLISSIRAFRPFLPAKDYPKSLSFYEAIGFEAYPLGEAMAELSLGDHAFLLNGHDVDAQANDWVMHVLVDDVRAWWRHLDSLDLAGRFGVPAPAPPRDEPWGLSVTYVTDPSGVFWHFAQDTEEMRKEA
jgi:uncharacterized glyoxalase superfamily protein PhnB